MQRHLFAAAVVLFFQCDIFVRMKMFCDCAACQRLSYGKLLLIHPFIYLFIFLCALFVTWAVIFTFQIALVCMGTLGAARERSWKIAPNLFCIHSFLTPPLFMGFPDDALPAARSAPEHLHETSCRRNAHQNKVQFSRSSRRDAAAGWREAFQEKCLHGV